VQPKYKKTEEIFKMFKLQRQIHIGLPEVLYNDIRTEAEEKGQTISAYCKSLMAVARGK
jgi:hypothetical protein